MKEQLDSETEYELAYCRNCMRETKHIVVWDRLLCTECKIYNVRKE